MIDLLSSLIEIESISGNEDRLVTFLLRWLRENDLAAVREGNNLVVELRAPGESYEGPTLLFCSHIDTVPPCAGWTYNPYQATHIDGRIIGLGANDALASVVSMIEALRGLSLQRGRVLLAIVCEEERGANGFVKLEPSLPRYDYAIFGEPTALRIGYCMRGSMKLRMITSGRSCHASRPHEGENAIFNLMSDLSKLKSLPLADDSPWGKATVEPVVITGGGAENQIPDRVETFLDCRPTFSIDNDRILELLREAGITFEVIRNIRRPMMCPKDSPLVQALKRASPRSELYPFGGSCDMAFSKAPSVVFGPGASERSHAPDEFIYVSELEDAVRAYRATIDLFFSAEI